MSTADLRIKGFGSGALIGLGILLTLVFSTATVLADQITLSYVDASAQTQTLIIDCSSSTDDLALAASLMAENGVGTVHDAATGCGTLAELAAALATAAPLFAPDVALVLVTLSPGGEDAIVAAINAVSGVDTNAVLAAVYFGSWEQQDGPQHVGAGSALGLELTEIEAVPSKN
jgi:hypothetical protein